MPVFIHQVEEGRPGDKRLLGSVSKDGRAAVVFEDDGVTGYVDACELVGCHILDAMQIYNVESVVDRDLAAEYKIGWSPGGHQALLLINGWPHAVFDFDREKGWCRSGFPPSN